MTRISSRFGMRTLFAAGLALAVGVGIQTKPAQANHGVAAFVVGALIGGAVVHHYAKRKKKRYRRVSYSYYDPHYGGYYRKHYRKRYYRKRYYRKHHGRHHH